MKINLLAIGKSMPAWITTGFTEYARRLPKDYQLNLIEIAAIKRTKTSSIERIKITESKMLLEAAKDSLIIALDEHGKSPATLDIAKHLKTWHDDQQDVSFLIGGPDGLSKECLAQARIIWSLSKLTLPHPLVRIVFAEQVYRAWSIINHHPYHRE